MIIIHGCGRKKIMKTKTKYILELLAQSAPDKYLKWGLLQKISQEAEVSRERVRVIAKTNGFISSRSKNNKYNHYLSCRQCGEVFKETKCHRIFCYAKCFKAWRKENCWVKLKCSQCKKVFKRTKAEYEQGQKTGRTMVFCNKKCFGRWLGLNYGKNHIKKQIKNHDTA